MQAAALGVLGLWLNTLVTEVDLVNLSLGQAAPPSAHPQRWLLLGFVAVSSLLFGQVWCGYLCPFGALQEFVSRLGRRLRLRSDPDRPLEQAARLLKFLLPAMLLVLVWVTGEGAWATFNPMQQVFGGDLDCIRCHRCVSGRDTQVPRGSRARGPRHTQPGAAPVAERRACVCAAPPLVDNPPTNTPATTASEAMDNDPARPVATPATLTP